MTILQPSNLNKRAAWLLGGAAAFVYLYGLGRLPFLGPDEPRYAQVGREMYERGDWVTPTLGGHPWFEKPAALYWLEIIGYKLFGVSEGAARLGPALCGLLTVALLYVIAKRSEPATSEERNAPRAAAFSLLAPRSSLLALWCSLTLATSLGLLAFARAASFDIVLTATVTLAVACFWGAETAETDGARNGWMAGWWAALGAATLAKGLAGLVLPGGIVFLYFALRRAWPARGWWLSMLWGVPLMILTASLWYAPVIRRHGWLFVDEFFLQHHFARYTSNKYRHPGPVWYYLPVMAGLTLPWTPFLIAALWDVKQWTWRTKDKLNKGHVLALAWLVWPMLFFSLSGSKLPGYVLPALPGAAWLAGSRLAGWQFNETKSGWPLRSTCLLFLLFAAGVLVYVKLTGVVSWGCALGVAAPLALAGAWAWARPRAGVWVLAGATLLAFAWPLHCDLTKVTRRESVRDLVQQAAARGYGGATVYHLHAVEHGAWFYAAGRVATDAQGEPVKFEGAAQLRDALRQRGGGPALAFIPLEHLAQLTKNTELRAEVIGDNGWLALVAVRLAARQ
jgi:4-amino-4-deoxy-L-arabinose transferase-like glycosyltransferase